MEHDLINYRKYLKYKKKYLLLKTKISGGVDNTLSTEILSDYFIASSHNTYLEGDQLISKSNTICYKNFLEFFGGGCIELDLIKYNEDIDDVEIKHQYTLTSIIYLRGVLEIIKDFISKHPESFIILSIDNKIKGKVLKKIYKIFEKVLDNYLYETKSTNYKINDIKGKVLLKWNKNIHDNSKTHFDKNNIISDSNYKKTDFTEIIENNKIVNDKYRRTYPLWYNTFSNNYPFIPQLINGTQMVALNIQKPDLHMMLMRTFFKDNFYIKKPEWMRQINTDCCYIPIKTFNLIFNDKFKSIKLYKQNETEFIESETNTFNINLIKDFEFCYIISTINNKLYHGVIIIKENKKSRLYKKTEKFNQMSCDWFMNLDNEENKNNYIDLSIVINNNIVEINI